MASVLFVANASTDDFPDSLVNARFDIKFLTGTYLKISVTLDVSEITVFGNTYDSNGIQTVANNDLQTLGAIKLRLRQLLEKQIESSFEYASFTSLNEKPIYENTLFYDEYGVNLTSSFFGLNETVNSHDFVNGVLDLDAIIYYAFNFHAEPGWNVTYTIILPYFMNYQYTTGSVENNKIQWDVKNRDGQNPKLSAELSIQLAEPTTPKLTEEHIDLEFKLDFSNINDIPLKTTILIKNVDIRQYKILPDFVNELEFVSSDGIRLFIDNEFLSWEDLYQGTIKSIEQNTISVIENSSFNQTLETSFNWDPETSTNCSFPYDTSNMDSDPPIKAVLVDKDIDILICDMSARAFFGLINAGGTANISAEDINFGDGFDEIKYHYDIILHLPNSISLAGKNIYSWNLTVPPKGEFVSELGPIPEYSRESIDTIIEIEISKMDLDLLSFFSGITKLAVSSYIEKSEHIYVMGVSKYLKISEKINLMHLGSDAIRLCTEEAVFNESDIDDYLENKKDIFEKRVSNIIYNLKIKGIVDKNLFYDSLNWDRDISNMDNVAPVVVSIYAHNIYPIDFNLSFWPPKISVSNQMFNLKGIENQSVMYRIIFPKGISIAARDTLDKLLIKGETNEGKEFVEISVDSNEASEHNVILVEISVSPVYALGLFLPCILSLVLVIILIGIVYLIRRKRKGGKVIQDNTELTGYEGQDYYVPPPPSSK
jgi:hypothetical protein